MIVSKELVTIYDPSKAYDGYTLFGQMGSRDLFLVDMKGMFVQRWRMPNILGVYGKLLPNGNLLVGQRLPTTPISDLPGASGQLLEIDWDGNVVWRYEDLYMNGHEFDRMENGNTLISVWMPMPDDVSAKMKGGIPGTEREGVMWGDCLQEITPDGKVAWQWAAHEHMDFETDILCPLCPREGTYVNSLIALPDGNILAHFRLINTIAIIDKKTGNIKWRWGPPDHLGHAHNATSLDNGNILIFDNGLHRPLKTGTSSSYSRVLEINPRTNEIVWEYRDQNLTSFYSSVCAGAQRLPNGNTLICEATKGRIFEVTSEKETVWEFTNPFYSTFRFAAIGLNNWVFRAYRYGPDYAGLRGKTLDPNKFLWVLQEEGKPQAEDRIDHLSPEDGIIDERLTRLGY